MVGFSSIAAAFFAASGDILGFLPLLRPRARAAFKPALVLSLMIARLNWAMDANKWNTSSPVEVSIDSVTETNVILNSDNKCNTHG